MIKPVFITGIGTDVGKTIISAIVVKALRADYWKPVQAGNQDLTDTQKIQSWLPDHPGTIHSETYFLRTPASPHIAARQEGITIDLKKIKNAANEIQLNSDRLLVIEGAGGLLVPLNENETVLDLIKMVGARVIIISRNYLGSINHSLLTAGALQNAGVEISGWIFNDQFMNYEEEIVGWTGIQKIGSVPFTENPDIGFIASQAEILKPALLKHLQIR